ncbi:MAG: 23S rRNA (pseudouridine(1915)-N(3))-methyltransferase RlmH, partial [Planifilum sp.]
MQLEILAVGKLKERYLKQGVEEYLKRLRPYARVNVVEVPEEKPTGSLSAAEETRIKEREGERILTRLHPDTHVIALAIEGDSLSSEELAGYINRLATYGQSRLSFIIGGSVGLSPDVLDRADRLLSFSKMTFPHQLMRLI